MEITNDALIYIKSIMEVSKNSIMHINLSRNNIDTNGINMLCSIIKKNPQLKHLKLTKNNINENRKKYIIKSKEINYIFIIKLSCLKFNNWTNKYI